MTEEIRTDLGYLKLPDGPINITDYLNIELTQNNFGIDIFSDIVLVGRTIDFKANENIDEETFKLKLGMITDIIVRYIEHNRIPGEIVLQYKLLQLGYDFKLVCKVYKASN